MAGAWRYAGAQPSFALRAAVLVFLIVIGLPLLLLLLLAFLVGAVVFGVLALFGSIGAAFRGVRQGGGPSGGVGANDGRENVRVIDRR